MTLGVAIFLVSSSVIYVSSNLGQLSLREFLVTLREWIPAASVLLASVMCLPYVVYLTKEVKFDSRRDRVVYQRYLVLALSRLIEIPLFALLFVCLLFPAAFALNEQFSNDFILPKIEAAITESRNAINSLETEEHDERERRLNLAKLDEILPKSCRWSHQISQ